MEFVPAQWIYAAFGACGVAIGALWKLVLTHQKDSREREERSDTKLEQCHTQHAEALQQVLEISNTVGDVRERLGRVEGQREGVELISQQVLDRIEELHEERTSRGET